MSLIQQALDKAGRIAQLQANVTSVDEDRELEFVSKVLQDSLPVSESSEKRFSIGLFAAAFFLTFGVMMALFILWRPIQQHFMPRPGNTAAVYDQHYRLSGITVSDNKHLALINDQVVGKGERIGHATVAEIQDSEVTLELNGKKIKLVLNS